MGRSLNWVNYSIDIKNLYSTICRDLKIDGNSQLPLLSSSNPSSRNFIFMPPSTVAKPIPAIIPVPLSAQSYYYVPTKVDPPPPQKPAHKPNQPIRTNMQSLHFLAPSRNRVSINMMANTVRRYVTRQIPAPSIAPSQRKIRNMHNSIYSNFRGLVLRSTVVGNNPVTSGRRGSSRISLIFH